MTDPQTPAVDAEREAKIDRLHALNAVLREFVDALDARDAEHRRFHVHYVRTHEENLQLISAADRLHRARAALSSEQAAADDGERE